ncbi:MAG: protein-S-isoprenylcysteine O-methyltransferase [Pseudomonadota bacterium]
MTSSIAAALWGATLIGWIAIRMPRRRKAKRKKVVAHRRSLWERTALGLCIAGLFVLPLIYFTTGFPAYANRVPYIWTLVLGTGVMIGFLVVFYLAHKQLADNWSVTLELREDHQLVQNGLYQYVRHPMYSSFWLWGIGQALLVPNWVAGFAGVVSVAVLYFSRVHQEEAMMRDQFGTQYDAYCAKTGRVIPRLGRSN